MKGPIGISFFTVILVLILNDHPRHERCQHHRDPGPQHDVGVVATMLVGLQQGRPVQQAESGVHRTLVDSPHKEVDPKGLTVRTLIRLAVRHIGGVSDVTLEHKRRLDVLQIEVLVLGAAKSPVLQINCGHVGQAEIVVEREVGRLGAGPGAANVGEAVGLEGVGRGAAGGVDFPGTQGPVDGVERVSPVVAGAVTPDEGGVRILSELSVMRYKVEGDECYGCDHDIQDQHQTVADPVAEKP